MILRCRGERSGARMLVTHRRPSSPVRPLEVQGTPVSRTFRAVTVLSGVRRPSLTTRNIDMKWETPQATDFRFGMEITMYIANR